MTVRIFGVVSTLQGGFHQPLLGTGRCRRPQINRVHTSSRNITRILNCADTSQPCRAHPRPTCVPCIDHNTAVELDGAAVQRQRQLPRHGSAFEYVYPLTLAAGIYALVTLRRMLAGFYRKATTMARERPTPLHQYQCSSLNIDSRPARYASESGTTAESFHGRGAA